MCRIDTFQNIFHGCVSLDQLYFNRPTSAFSDYRCPVPNLYLCGSGAHPGWDFLHSKTRSQTTPLKDRFYKKSLDLIVLGQERIQKIAGDPLEAFTSSIIDLFFFALC